MTTAKHELRQTMRARLEEISSADAAAAAEHLAERASGLPEVADARRVLVCLSFGVEPPTAPLRVRLEASGRALFIPRLDRRLKILSIHPASCELETLPLGLRQPVAGSPEIDPSTLDLAILVGLGFDRSGYRLGHGGGHFDRFLAATEVPAIGYAFEAQVVDSLPVETHDVPMRAVVTEDDLYRSAAARATPS